MRRKLLMTATVLIFLTCIPVWGSPAQTALKANESLLLKLDSIIASQKILITEKEKRIDRIRTTLSRIKSPAEKLGLNRELYDEYLVYDSDSALRYARNALALTRECAPGNYDMITEWTLNVAFIYTVQGLYDQAMKLVRDIDPSRLDDAIRAKYYNTMEYIHSMRSVYLRSNEEIWREDMDRSNLFRDSICNIRTLEGDEYLWAPVAMTMEDDGALPAETDVERLQEAVDNATGASRTNAINSYWLARYYDKLHDETLMARYMIKAATYDALIVNREIAAIQELATWLFDNGQLNRAYNYLIYAVNQANAYHNRYRMVSLSDVLPTVRDAYRVELDKRDARLRQLVIMLGILSLVLLGSIVFIVLEMRRLKRTRNQLSVANSRLHVSVTERDSAIAKLKTANDSLAKANDDLAHANDELAKANARNLGLLAYAFRLTTEYINAIDDYRKKLLRKFKNRQIDDLGVILNDPENIREHYKGFYEGFDKTILSIFPDFIEEYNSHADDGDKVSAETVKRTGALNTKLRIHALNRLGMDKSADIARMLNVSIRTVYNNR